jgi:hypothetical protein
MRNETKGEINYDKAEREKTKTQVSLRKNKHNNNNNPVHLTNMTSACAV